LEIFGQPIDNLCAPAFRFLPLENVAPDRPVEHHHLFVDGEGRFDLGGANALLEVFEEAIVVGWLEGISHDGGAVGILLSLCCMERCANPLVD
jgi:hypothetical protein